MGHLHLLTGHRGCGIIIYGGEANPSFSLDLARAQPSKLLIPKLLDRYTDRHSIAFIDRIKLSFL